MGISLTIFNLYALHGGSERFLLVKAQRSEFPNWSQPAEDAAIAAVDSRFDALVAAQQGKLGFQTATLAGTWEDGYPEGDVFYSDESDIPVEVWLAGEMKYGRYFVFGMASSEPEFWEALRELHASGNLWGFVEFTRPARRERVWFVQ